jgi:putative RNA 2'-phosphotransferase
MHEMRSRPPRTDQGTDRLGRFLALVLRHKPESIGITLDSAGFVEVAVLAQAIAAQPGWSSVTADAIRAATQKDAKRYELSGDRVRARYGHSVPIATPGKVVIPPEWLYHGTPPSALDALRQQGLHPQGRQFVHLSVTRQDALTIGQRHSPDAVVVTVQARGAHDTGILFYQASSTVYLVREVPPTFLRVP